MTNTCGRCKVVIAENNPYVHIHPYTKHEYTLCYNCYIDWQLAGRPDSLPESAKIKPKQSGFVAWFVLALLILLCLVLWPLLAQAQSAVGMKLGDTLLARAPVCLTEKAALAVAQADHERGVDAAMKQLVTGKQCGIAVIHMKLVRVVKQFTTERGADLKVIEVLVEMRDNTWKTAWVIADVPIQGAHSA